MHVERFEKEITHRLRSAEVVIESSLWNAMVKNDLPAELALELSDIYAWTIDFFGLQKGDSIRVYYDEQYVDSTRIGIGRIYAADFYHARMWQEAFWFEDGNIHNYFDAEGNSLRKAFLKAPLNYKRISSKFTYARKHPVYKVVRPHTGVDYAAPTGTPVVSIGDGVVTMKQYKGGGGNTVKIKHNSTYTTAYLHLSKYAKGLAVGKRVKQGEVIGYVGSTGASTGPHLDFRVWKNDSPIDPLKMQSPPAEPIPPQYKDTFATVVAKYREHLQH
jgi:murein DD-endopeptidase MepM/ murein hydrolase activator NlpD